MALMDGWTYADLRSLDPLDAGADDVDIIAIYTRDFNDEIQIRLDLVDITPGRVVDFFVAIDYSPGGSHQLITDRILEFGNFSWEYVLYFSSNGQNAIYDFTNELIDFTLSVYFDIVTDAVYVALPQDLFLTSNLSPQSFYKIKVFVFDKDNTLISDQIGPISGNPPPPPGASILLSFYDAYLPVTPSQALRSWDGAHTGPNSERHGYRYLLKAAQRYKVPFFLSDAAEPGYEISLNYMGVLNFVGVVGDLGLVNVGQVCRLGNDYAKYNYLNATFSATQEGLARDTIRELLNTALQGNGKYIVLCAPLENTNWGIPEVVNNTIRYISTHPWIRPLGAASLPTYALSNQTRDPSSLDDILAADQGIQIVTNSDLSLALLQAINSVPDNQLGKYANYLFDTLASEIYSSDRQRYSDYISLLGHIINAAHWVSSPTPLVNCQDDIDWDGQTECILTTKNIYSILETRGGYLSYLVYLTPDGSPHQIISPAYQQSLILDNDDQRDSGQADFEGSNEIIGAFVDVSDATLDYRYKLSNQQITFYHPDSTIEKKFGITTNSLEIQITDAVMSQNYQIPFIIDPWNIASSTWLDSYTVGYKDDILTISTEDPISITIYSSSPPSASSFITPREAMSYPEDPNYDYTPGYYLPFTLTKCIYNSVTDLKVDILFTP